MDFLRTPVAFIFVLGVIIFVHEFGHFITAKAFGMRVFIFSFGFGKRLFGFKWGGTDLRVSLIPLGGYVKLEGEPDDFISDEQGPAAAAAGAEPIPVDSPHYFTNRPRWQRLLVYVAGPFMNAALTVSVLSVLFMFGSQVDASLYDRPVIGAVEPGSPAAAAGLQPGDEILEIDGKPQSSWEDVRYNLMIRPDTTIRLKLRRDGELREVAVHSGSDAHKAGQIGVWAPVRIGRVVDEQPPLPAAQAGLRPDDAILRIDGKVLTSFDQLIEIVTGSRDKPLAFTILREGRSFDVTIAPRGGKIGIERKTLVKKFGPAGAVREALRTSWAMTRQTFEVVGRLLTAKISPKTMMGPLGIAKASGSAAEGGALALFHLIAVISLQVGILNLFPLAPLDGGHMALLLVESVIRRDLSMAVKAWIMNAGALMLFLLIGVVLYSDLSKVGALSKYLP